MLEEEYIMGGAGMKGGSMPEKPFVEVITVFKREYLYRKAPTTQKVYRNVLEKMRKAFRGKVLTWNDADTAKGKILTADVVDRYVSERLQGKYGRSPASPSTVATELRIGSSAVMFYRRSTRIRVPNPFSEPNIPGLEGCGPRLRVLSPVERQKLAEMDLPEPYPDLFNFCLIQGFRPSESLNLTWDRIVGDVIVFGANDHKKRRKSERFLWPEAAVILERQPKQYQYVFVRKNVNGQVTKIPYRTAYAHWQRWLQKNGLEDLQVRDLRTTRGQEVRMLHGLEVAQHVLDHEHYSTTERAYSPKNIEIVRRAAISSIKNQGNDVKH